MSDKFRELKEKGLEFAKAHSVRDPDQGTAQDGAATDGELWNEETDPGL